MSCLTESSLLFNGCEPKNQENPENQKKPEKNNRYYDMVYLCVEKKNINQQAINGFNCYTFKDFSNADAYYKNNINNKENRHTMIPVCKWIPMLFHKQYLNHKLKQLYWNDNITILRNQRYT
jgi:hypothetical protein